ncbi:erythromycin esterase family protein [Metabacillus malikii]|uniref:Erythromycin esterase-like protein n=1 Tax=Metabacillus malikii TaxID=1504265 RepID=A0ABT9ZAP4_9BACI|nr:erythromycin esterase family protein [Metabacillus malikii]MDQ0229331.1 erythromycin esterase-like protein [Metabacillus malikii]
MNKQIIQAIKHYAKPYIPHDNQVILNEIDEQKFVLLGESSHGTSEFYKIRSDLTKQLITEKGFTFIAVEGDWPACMEVNRYIKGYDHEIKSAKDALKKFNRWPTWMWANEEMIELIDWLKKYNQDKTSDKQVGFYGIDIYSLWESMDEIIHYFKKVDSTNVESIKRAFECFEPFNRQPEKYGLSAAFYQENCHDEVIQLLLDIMKQKHHLKDLEESHLNIEANALLTANAEHYYRTMIINDNESWNIRDRHMVQLIITIAHYYGKDSKGIIWEHNTHVGDARATDMADEGVINVGQLLREQFSEEEIFIVGFGTHRGTVIAADQWGINLERMVVPKAKSNSWEDLMHQASDEDKIIIFNKENQHIFEQTVGHRAIGVVYHPQREHFGNYVPSSMSKRYNAFIFIDQTTALTPLKVEEVYL